MKTICTLLALLLITLQIAAQSNIAGRVIDSRTSQPIELVNVKLLQNDSTFVKGCISDVDGIFELTNILASDYILVFSCIA